MLDEDDLCPFDHVQEITSDDDILYTLDLIISLKIHHVHSHLACIHLSAKLLQLQGSTLGLQTSPSNTQELWLPSHPSSKSKVGRSPLLGQLIFTSG